MISVEIEPKLFQIRAYKGKADNYIASCQVFKYGDRGFVYSIMGALPDVYESLNFFCEKIFSLGIVTLEGYVTESHVRLFKRALRGSGMSILTEHSGMMADREMPWIVIKRKEGC